MWRGRHLDVALMGLCLVLVGVGMITSTAVSEETLSSPLIILTYIGTVIGVLLIIAGVIPFSFGRGTTTGDSDPSDFYAI